MSRIDVDAGEPGVSGDQILRFHPVGPTIGDFEVQLDGRAVLVGHHPVAASLVTGGREIGLGLRRVERGAEGLDLRRVDVLAPHRQEASRVGGGDDIAVVLDDDVLGVDGLSEGSAEGRVVERLVLGVRDEPRGVAAEHVRRIREVGRDTVPAVDDLGDAGQVVVVQVEAAGQKLAEGDVVGAVDDVNDVRRLDAEAQGLDRPPGRVLDPDHAVLGGRLVGVRAGADAVLVQVLKNVGRGRVLAPDRLRDHRHVVQGRHPFLVSRGSLERHDDVVTVGGDLVHEVEQHGAERGVLIDVDREGHVVGGEGRAVSQRHTLADVDRVRRLGTIPGPAGGEPRGVDVLDRVVQEERFVLEAHDAHRHVGIERVPGGRSAPLLAAGVQGFRARVDSRVCCGKTGRARGGGRGGHGGGRSDRAGRRRRRRRGRCGASRAAR